ncbi:MAG: hypothetical protein ABSF69_28735 [Polyangiaceae bacterium]
MSSARGPGQGVLAHLTMRFVSQRENFATEALAYILNSSKAALGALQQIVAHRVSGFPLLARVATQEAAGPESRPDVTLISDDGSVVAFLEAKFWAGLTQAQPVDYVKRLQAVGGKAILFLVPERRVASLRGEVMERARASGSNPQPIGAHDVLVDGVHVAVLSWRQLLSGLAEAAQRGDERGTVADIQQVEALCVTMETQGFIPLSDKELTDLDVPRRVISLIDLGSEIVDEGVRQGILNVMRLRATHGWHTAGRYAAFKRAGCWIGLSHRRWLEHGQPLWARFNDDAWGRAREVRRAVESLMASEPPHAYLIDEAAVALPLFVRAGASKEDAVRDAVAQMRAVDEMMLRAGMPELAAEGPGPAPEQ